MGSNHSNPIAECSHECYWTSRGQDYSGRFNVTMSGKTCQRWDQQTPHTHDRNNPLMFPEAQLKNAENYCRNPDLEPRPWCYTVDPASRWEYCDVAKCSGTIMNK